MANEIEKYTATVDVTEANDAARSTGYAKLREHALAKAEAWDYAEFITSTGMCPDIFRGKPKDATVAILRGAMLGFDPDSSLEALFVIHGKVGMYAKAKYAVAISRGADMYEVEASDTSVTWAGTKPGESHIQSVTWTIERAEKAKYTSNAKYATNPQQMLRAKCQSELADILAPGALLGLIDEVDRETQPVIQATAERVQAGPKRGTAGLAERLGVTAEPAPAAEAEPANPDAPTKEQLEHLNALLEAEKLTTKKAKLDYLEAQYGRKFTSSADLKFDEAADLIGLLAREQSADEAKAAQA